MESHFDNGKESSPVDRLFAEYLRRLDNGENIDREEFLRQHEKLADELHLLMEANDQVEEFADLEQSIADSPLNSQSRIFGDYELLSSVKSSMGIVYKARQKSLGRVVALKLLRWGPLATEEDIARFENEAKAASLLDHPGIVSVYDYGECDGERYYSMPYVDGQTLADRISLCPLPSLEAAAVIAKVVDAVAYAHSRGVIHRDLKPSNILLDEERIPKLTDFGLAKIIEGSNSFTATGDVLGTPNYMSPEQAGGLTAAISASSDVYSIGASLYAALTGRPPFQSSNVAEILRQVQFQEPISPRKLVRSIPRDLETICLKCLEKDPTKRYATADAVAFDLNRFLQCEPIVARPVGFWEHAAKWARRHPSLVAVTSCFLFLTAISMTLGIILISKEQGKTLNALGLSDANFRESEIQKKRAIAAAQKSQENAERSEQLVYAADIKLAAQAWESGDTRRFSRLLDRHIPRDGQEDRRGFEWHFLRQHGRAEYRNIAIRTGGTSFVQHSPDGRFLVTGNHDGTICLWDSSNYKLLGKRLAHSGLVRWADFSPDGNLIATIGDDGVANIWDLNEYHSIRRIKAINGIGTHIFFSSDNKAVICGGEESRITLWDVETGEANGELTGIKDGIESMVLSPNGSICFGCDNAGYHRIWDLTSLKQVHEFLLPLRTEQSLAISFSFDGRLVVLGTDERLVRILETQSWTLLASFAGHETDIQDVSFHPSGSIVASSDKDGVIRIWPLKNISEVEDHVYKQWLHMSEYLPNGLLCLQTHKEVHLYNRESREFSKIPLGPKNHPTFAYLRYMRNLVSYSADAARLVYRNEIFSTDPELHDGWHLQNRLPIENHVHQILTSAISRNGKVVAIGNRDGVVQLWDANKGMFLAELKAEYTNHDGISVPVNCVTFSPDDRHIAAGYKNGRVVIWDASLHAEYITLDGHQHDINQVTFSADGKWLASAGVDRSCRLWNWSSGRQVAEFTQQGDVLTTAFSPNGSMLAYYVHSPDEMIHLLDINTQKVLLSLKPGSFINDSDRPENVTLKDYKFDVPNRISFSPDGKWLATGGQGFHIRFYPIDDILAQNRWPSFFQGHSARAWSLNFSPDGSRLVSASKDGNVRAWTGREQTKKIVGGTADALAVAFSHTNGELYIACTNAIKIWNPETKKYRVLGERFSEPAICVALSPDGMLLCTGHQDSGAIRVWDTETGDLKETFIGHDSSSSVEGIAFSADGSSFVTASWDGTGKIWETSTCQRLATFEMPPHCEDVAVSIDGKYISFSTEDDAIVFDTQAQNHKDTLEGHQNTVETIAFSPVSRLLATGSHDRTVRIWNIETKECIHEIPANRDRIYSVAFSPDGKTIATGGNSGTVVFSHVETGQFLFETRLGNDRIRDLQFSSDGKTLVVVVNGIDDRVFLLRGPNQNRSSSARNGGPVLSSVKTE